MCPVHHRDAGTNHHTTQHSTPLVLVLQCFVLHLPLPPTLTDMLLCVVWLEQKQTPTARRFTVMPEVLRRMENLLPGLRSSLDQVRTPPTRPPLTAVWCANTYTAAT